MTADSVSYLPFASARAASAPIAEIIRPRPLVYPSEAAKLNLRNDRGPYDASVAPMMAEPLDMMASRVYTGVVFIGPSRSSKTFSLVHGAWTWAAVYAPGDALIVQMSQEAARDFSRREVDMIIANSPEIAERLSPRAQDDNIFDKTFRSGMNLKLGWPALSQLSSKTLRFALVTDYDRPENRDDVEGQAALWDLAAKRVETYMSRGKVLAESSPGETFGPNEIGWRPSSPHEGPPVLGIVAIYNRGTRARWYWRCTECGEHFQVEPGLAPFHLPAFEEIAVALKAEAPASLARRLARVPCPHCGYDHRPEDRLRLNSSGTWLHEGDRIVDGRRDESGRRPSSIASYWLGGAAATHRGWEANLADYFSAVAEFEATGDEAGLKGAVSMGFAGVHLPRALATRRSSERLAERAEELERGVVPAWARFLTAAVDISGHAFPIGVMAWGSGLEAAWVDRFDITASRREEGERTAALDPGAYIEDWRLLEDEVLALSYPVDGVEGARLAPRLVLCDSGGREGVTSRAYDFWREMKRKGFGHRFRLVKGDGRPSIPRVQETYPDTRGRADRHAAARGDVPVWVLAVNQIKDGVAKDLERAERGPGFVHLPAWGGDAFYRELAAESRGPRGWVGKSGVRNESWDLHVYNRAATIILGAERINWASPPSWAAAPVAAATRAAKTSARTERAAALARDINQE